MAQEEGVAGQGPIGESIALMARLRGPDGCPWDREQTFDSIKRHTLEETYEVFDAIERRAWPDLKDELGDLLLQVLFYSQMAAEAGYFTVDDVAANLNAKLIRRHPHIFGDAVAADVDAVLRNWEQIKQVEKAAGPGGTGSLLDDIPRSMPAVMEAGKLGSRAAKVGFDWPDSAGLFGKLDEEIAELKVELGPEGSKQTAEEELGDLLFTAVNLARHLRLDPEAALRGANAKFRLRFAAMEQAAGGAEKLGTMTAAELDALWCSAKATLKAGRYRMGDAIRIAPLDQLGQFDRCVELQIAVWGYSDGDVIPRRMFLVAQRIGGQVLGAFDGDVIVGFAMALPGYRDRTPYLHSHMLAVLPEYRDHGLGRRLKLAQRDDALARGFELMEWTFDPLEIKNAYLNIHRLGAIVRRYHPDFYGPSSSPLQGGLPTDRLYAEWWLRSPRVEARLRGETLQETTAVRVSVPAGVSGWKQEATQRTLATELQTKNRTALQAAFKAGLAVVEYERDTEGNGAFLLGPWNA